MRHKLIRKYDQVVEYAMRAVRWLELALGPGDDWVEEDRRILFETAQLLFGRWHTFTREKTVDEYVFTVNATPDVVEHALFQYGPYQRNLASSRKYRTHHGGGKQWAVGSFVHDPRDEPWQHHVYIFEADGEDTDVYAHTEASVRHPVEHLTDKQEDADPHVLPYVFDDAGLDYGERF